MGSRAELASRIGNCAFGTLGISVCVLDLYLKIKVTPRHLHSHRILTIGSTLCFLLAFCFHLFFEFRVVFTRGSAILVTLGPGGSLDAWAAFFAFLFNTSLLIMASLCVFASAYLKLAQTRPVGKELRGEMMAVYCAGAAFPVNLCYFVLPTDFSCLEQLLRGLYPDDNWNRFNLVSGFAENRFKALLLHIGVICVVLAILPFLTFVCKVYIKRNLTKNTLTDKTRRLVAAFSKTLLIQSSIPVVCYIILGSAFGIVHYFFPSAAIFFEYELMTFLHVPGILIPLMNIIFIPPYREYVRVYLRHESGPALDPIFTIRHT